MIYEIKGRKWMDREEKREKKLNNLDWHKEEAGVEVKRAVYIYERIIRSNYNIE